MSSPTMSMKAETIRIRSLPSVEPFGAGAPGEGTWGASMPLMLRVLNEHRRDACRQERRDAPADQGFHAELRERGSLIRCQRADAADLNADRRDVRESAQGVREDHQR